ncbi:hypothetical protein BD289DRAFT_366366 [Coniella lustricola]|uniref:Uncharacterized protein n=1 Tax=Coniella lustricola TaxID=2025994 RepID=A0A2T3AAZ9_9PEZI|nr:hypothetical protein BD289DRAFT_366366 [Coniella lustricola]
MAGSRSSEAVDLAALEASAGQPDALQCCCGNADCGLLKHNYSILDSVEKDVHTAARLGQALLARHEALMASAETERFEMQSRIDQLETDKKSLEAENARSIHENRSLLDQLEAMNSSVADSETHIKSLEAALQNTQQSLRSLEGAETRVAELEDQLGLVETEQAELHNTLVTTQAEARSAMQRWRIAEKGISEMQEKLERMEREAVEERGRHSDILSRIERQRTMEKDLYTAAGRLKGAAAAKNMTDGKTGGAVVSHFVRDLLSDNANLQLGMAELRELLMNSNDEIQHLREQLIFHQVAEDEPEAGTASTLRTELDFEESDARSPRPSHVVRNTETTPSGSQEVHIHHHYHVTRPAEPRKPLKKKRQGLAPNVLTAAKPFSPSGPTSPAHWRLEHRATSPSLVSHSVKDSISTIQSTRWSVFSDQPSDFAPSSVPSSPMSSHRRRISLFDQEYESPGSPSTSVDHSSPAWNKLQRHQNPDSSTRMFSMPRPLLLENTRRNTSPFQYAPQPSPITSHVASTDIESEAVFSMPTSPSYDDSFVGSRPRLRRASSQESIISLSGGLDIHTLKVRPSQLALRPLGSVSAETELSAVIAQPTITKGTPDGKRGSLVLRDSLLNLPSLIVTSEAPSDSEVESTGSQRQTSGGSIGRIVHWRPWGGAKANNAKITCSSRDTPHRESNNTRKKSSSSSATTPKDMAFSPRSYGINQAGAIPGFTAYWAAHQMKGPPTQVVPQNVDTDALRDGLME